jgi:hypothetical protein
MTRQPRKAVITIAATGFIGAFLAAAPAHAETIPENTGEHCVLSTSTGAERCYGTFTEAIRTASAAGVHARGEVIQGTFFDNREYGGDSYTVVGAGLCDGSDGVINYQIDMPPEWRDRISSVQPWANCKIWLYPDLGLNGDRDGPFTQNTGWVGDFMDDRTDSIGFS